MSIRWSVVGWSAVQSVMSACRLVDWLVDFSVIFSKNFFIILSLYLDLWFFGMHYSSYDPMNSMRSLLTASSTSNRHSVSNIAQKPYNFLISWVRTLIFCIQLTFGPMKNRTHLRYFKHNVRQSVLKMIKKLITYSRFTTFSSIELRPYVSFCIQLSNEPKKIPFDCT